MNTQHNTARGPLLGVIEGHVTQGYSIGSQYAIDLADAIMDGFVVIPRTDIPDAESVEGGAYVGIGKKRFSPGQSQRQWEIARDHIALALYAEGIESVGAERNARRDELAREFAGDGAFAYRFAASDQQAAIDRIIELEEAVK